jgi:hypothetical protein
MKALEAVKEIISQCHNLPHTATAARIEELARALLALSSAAGAFPFDPWRPISTAPKDGTMVDLWCRSPGISAGPDRIPDCWFAFGQWRTHDPDADEGYARVYNVKFWMPRPLPPGKDASGP